MSIADAFAPYEAEHKNRIITETFGHLFPKPSTEPIRGMVRVAQTAYSGAVIIELEIDIPDSPWWYTAIHDFISDYELEYGKVYQFTIDVFIKTGLQELPYYYEIESALEADGWDDWLIEYSKPKYYEFIDIKELEAELILDSMQ